MLEPTAIDALVLRAQAGDQEAFGALVMDFEWPVRAWITARCPAGADADDVAQTTFVEAFKNLGRYQVMAELTRLRRLADYHERYFPHALWQELERRALMMDLRDDERLTALRDCLAALDDDDRALLTQRYSDEMPLRQMAQLRQRSEGAIKKSLFQLREQLHTCLIRRLRSEHP